MTPTADPIPNRARKEATSSPNRARKEATSSPNRARKEAISAPRGANEGAGKPGGAVLVGPSLTVGVLIGSSGRVSG